MRLLRASFWFYMGLAPVCWVVTVACAYTIFMYTNAPAGLLMFLKILTTGLFCWITIQIKKKELFYYYNIGVTQYQLVAGALIMDIMIFKLIIALVKGIT